MSRLISTVRNDYLRISLCEPAPTPAQINSMQAEFVELLDSTPATGMVVVDLPNHEPARQGLLDMLQNWHQLTVRAGRRFRLNGDSNVVAQVCEHIASAPILPLHPREDRAQNRSNSHVLA